MFGGARIGRVSPEALRVAARGTARLRVEGRGYGTVRVGGLRRWIWGSFDETFAVLVPVNGARVAISVGGMTGRARREIPCSLVVDVDPPALVTAFPRIRSSVRVPNTSPLVYQGARAPRLSPLRVSSSTFESTENESTP